MYQPEFKFDYKTSNGQEKSCKLKIEFVGEPSDILW